MKAECEDFPVKCEESVDIDIKEELLDWNSIEVESVSEIKTFHHCNNCNTRFHHEASLEKHLENGHEKIRFPSEKSKKEFTENSNLNQDVKASHEETIQSNHECPKCKRVFKKKSSLIQHTEAVHEESIQSNHKCSTCKRAFKRNSSLIKHTRAVHNPKRKPRIYKCNMCMETFESSISLRYHKICVHFEEIY